jgi:hypothetical protein
VSCEGGGVEVGGSTTPGSRVAVNVGTTAACTWVGSAAGSGLKFTPSAPAIGLSGTTTIKMTTTIMRNVATTNITARILKKLTAHPPPRELRLAAILFPSIITLTA